MAIIHIKDRGFDILMICVVRSSIFQGGESTFRLCIEDEGIAVLVPKSMYVDLTKFCDPNHKSVDRSAVLQYQSEAILVPGNFGVAIIVTHFFVVEPPQPSPNPSPSGKPTRISSTLNFSYSLLCILRCGLP